MRPPVQEPLFLERQSYRRRRLGDAARLLPLFGGLLFLLPILLSDSARTAGGLIFLFTVWALLIIVMAGIATRLAAPDDGRSDPELPGD